MKQVIKVSIGNIAFTLEEDAHKIMKDYLADLNNHYKDNPNGQEIVDGIEERAAELLLERGGREGGVISNPVVMEVISILGKPEDIDQESGENDKTSSARGNSRRKLYRDPSNVIFGGVCSGLAAYFNRDVLLFRFLFVIFTIGFSFFHMHIGGSFFIFLYIVLWIVLPPARTTEQKCAMRGEAPTVKDIQKNIEKGAKEIGKNVNKVREDNPNFWSNVGKMFRVLFGFIFFLIGIMGIIACVVVPFGIQIWGFGIPVAVMDFITIVTGATAGLLVFYKILALCLIFIPFVGLLYGGILMLFGIHSPKWRPGLILFLVWVASLIGLVAMSIGFTSRYWNSKDKTSTDTIALSSDTLFIKYQNVERWRDDKIFIDADKDEYNLMFVSDSDKDNPKIVHYPTVKLRRNGDSESKIVANTNIFTHAVKLSDLQDISQMNFYHFDGKTLTLDPVIYDKDKTFTDVDRQVKLYVDENTVVIVESPVYHKFESSFEYTNIVGLRKWIGEIEW